jgi:hypothetical protein
MGKGTHQIVDPMKRKMECALDPDRFISYNNCFGFVRNLEEVESEIAMLVTSEPARAASLYEALLAGCNEKANEIDNKVEVARGPRISSNSGPEQCKATDAKTRDGLAILFQCLKYFVASHYYSAPDGLNTRGTPTN